MIRQTKPIKTLQHGNIIKTKHIHGEFHPKTSTLPLFTVLLRARHPGVIISNGPGVVISNEMVGRSLSLFPSPRKLGVRAVCCSYLVSGISFTVLVQPAIDLASSSVRLVEKSWIALL
ncbi:hypothetical protein RND81_06G112200 [Saponaria officinalis]|uniref:Uncharacterized protein n=1 Tax=Saponaria officinalis TaxID=3572 RepID=A0AAW1KA48_SAPOF